MNKDEDFVLDSSDGSSDDDDFGLSTRLGRLSLKKNANLVKVKRTRSKTKRTHEARKKKNKTQTPKKRSSGTKSVSPKKLFKPSSRKKSIGTPTKNKNMKMRVVTLCSMIFGTVLAKEEKKGKHQKKVVSPPKFYSGSELFITSKEKQLFDLLREVSKDVMVENEDTKKQEKLVVRVAGGWVRDRLLGRDNDDIDLALNFMTGSEFAHLVSEYISKNNPDEQKSKKVSVIKANPEKSKHLETATMDILGFEVDMVNLRSEKYIKDSRIPVMGMGNPKQDAERRDLTINALYYNLDTQKVEDFTGKGRSDIENRIARTPLDPLNTFKDDPLRILRLVRFSARYNLTIDPKIYATLKTHHEEITKIFNAKIDVVRIKDEMEKIMAGPDPRSGLFTLFKDFDLFECIIKIKPSKDELERVLDNIASVSDMIQNIEECVRAEKRNLTNIDVLDKLHPDAKIVLYLAAIMEPFNKTRPQQKYKGKIIKSFAFFHLVSNDILRYTIDVGDMVETLLEFLGNKLQRYSHQKFMEQVLPKVHNTYNNETKKRTERLLLGRFVREVERREEKIKNIKIWCVSLIFSFAVHGYSYQELQSLLSDIYLENLQETDTLMPLLDGKEMKNLVSDSKLINFYKEKLIDEQIKNPFLKKKEDALSFIAKVIHS